MVVIKNYFSGLVWGVEGRVGSENNIFKHLFEIVVNKYFQLLTWP